MKYPEFLWIAAISALAALAQPAAADEAPSAFDREAAVAYSQGAIGRRLGDYAFVDSTQSPVQLAQFRGKPLVVNLVFTACAESCPIIVQTLYRAVEVAQEAFGPDSFAVITIGFDSRNDTPARMRAFARGQGVDLPNWRFLSGDAATLESLIEELGFIYFPSPRGFDHLAQTTVIDAQGQVYRQIYGDSFEPPALVESLKSLALAQDRSITDLTGLIERVRLFCTFYDPKRDRYRVDYSIVVGIAVGGLSLAGLAVVAVRGWLRGAPPNGA